MSDATDDAPDRALGGALPLLPDDPDDDSPPVDPLAVIAAIREPVQALPVADLHALSAASDDLARRWLAVWPTLPVERRRELLAAFRRLSIDDATLDFSRPHLIAVLDPDAATRMLGIRGLWEYDRAEYLLLLLDRVRSDPDSAVRVVAAEALGQFVLTMEFDLLTEEIAERLSETLRDVVTDVTEEDEVRAAALVAIGASSEEWVAELITEIYSVPGTVLRVAALYAMGRNAADEWLPILIYNFEDEDPDIRTAAATAAGQLLLEDAVEPLTALTADDEREVRKAAIAALGEIAGDAAETVLVGLSRDHDVETAALATSALRVARLIGIDFNTPSEDV